LSKPKVLLVDDNPAFLECLARMLKRDFSVVGAIRDGPRAIDAVAILQPDVIVMDISMPEMSGLEVARRLLDTPPRPPVVFVTVHEDREFMEAAHAVGAAGYVVKARTESELRPTLTQALNGVLFELPAL